MLASQGEARANLLPGPLPGGYHACCPLPPVEHLEGARSSWVWACLCKDSPRSDTSSPRADLGTLLHKHAQQPLQMFVDIEKPPSRVTSSTSVSLAWSSSSSFASPEVAQKQVMLVTHAWCKVRNSKLLSILKGKRL